MLRRFTRFSLALVLPLGCLAAGNAWALGLGEIRLESALNSPLRAEIELLSATPEELDALEVKLASVETFERYGLVRSPELQELTFEIVRSGRPDGNYVRVRSRTPISEPFLTFLVEANWARGRLLREYTVLLDPPTFAPPPSEPSQPAVQAPQRAAPADRGRIQREPEPRQPAATPAPAPAPVAAPRTEPAPAPVASDEPFDTTPGGDYVVQRNETLWGIAQRVRPDGRLTMNQTMLAIYEANRDAFGGNINILRAGATLRLPSADEIIRIDRGEALSEVQRQHSAWDGGAAAPVAADDARPSLQLVPPDDDSVGLDTGTEGAGAGEQPVTREQELEQRIAEIEAAGMPSDPGLIEIRNNELASLRQALADIRGEVYEPVIEEPPVDDAMAGEEPDSPFVEQPTDGAAADPFPEFDEDIMADDTAAGDDVAVDTEAPVAEADEEPATTTVVRRAPEPSLVDRAMGWLTSIWALIGGALIVALGILAWFLRRGRGDEEEGPWGARSLEPDVGDDDMTLTGTESLRAPSRDDESIVVVEQGSGGAAVEDDTLESPAADLQAKTGDTGETVSLEDTFSSETAVNLDQSDPIAEADFHMAYGLYDQAADLINGALEAEPEREDYLTKLCEIYFVWGNRDAFVDAASRVRRVIGEGDSSDWDKIVIMGQQIASDHELFAGAGVAGATRAVDLTFESDGDGTGALDMEFGDDSSGADIIDLGAGGDDSDDDIFDLGAPEPEKSADDSALDFDFGGDDATAETSESPTLDSSMIEKTREMPARDETVESPTLEHQAAGTGDDTSELPSFDEREATGEFPHASDQTAEIDLDDLGLDVSDLDETEVASADDLDVTGTNEALEEDTASATGRNPEVDPDATGVQKGLETDSTGLTEALDDLEEALSSTQTGMRLAADETGVNPFHDVAEDTDTGIDTSLLDATGRTQIISDDMAVETAADAGKLIGDDEATRLASLDDDEDEATEALGDDDKTMLAPGVGDDDDFDFAKTEALPADAFANQTDLDETGELPAVASTDVDLDLDDLTAALQVSGAGDTVDMPREDKTVEQPRPPVRDDDENASTQSLGPDDMSDDLNEARTMTEVGTKLDLARAYVDMGDPGGARSILEEVLDEGDASQRQQAQQLLDSLPG